MPSAPLPASSPAGPIDFGEGGRSMKAILLAGLAVAVVSLGEAACAQPAKGVSPKELTGVWTNAALTQLQRPAGLPLVVDEVRARAIAASNPMVRRAAAETEATDPSEGAGEATDSIQGHNAFWLDPGSSLGRVNGEYRTSWIVEPEDGRLPLTEAGRQASRAAALRRDRQDPEGPEDLSPNDRCLIGSRGMGGPGMLNNIYNSNYQIVQTPGAVAIMVEMVHDVRVIPLFADKASAQAGHGPAALQRWLGDSVGWWEGDTLVVETVHVNPQQGTFGPIFLSSKGRVVERFRRVSPEQIAYSFEVEDDHYYTRPWRAEMSLNAIEGPIYEYACHEGNYAIAGVLAGARAAEAASGP